MSQSLQEKYPIGSIVTVDISGEGEWNPEKIFPASVVDPNKSKLELPADTVLVQFTLEGRGRKVEATQTINNPLSIRPSN